MNIIKTNFSWREALSNRKATDYIVFHHRAGSGDVLSIHAQHQRQGYSGIGYHFYIRKDGRIYEGRPIDKQGAHCIGYNQKSVGVCFEGNFENEKMTASQIKSGTELFGYLKKLYPKAREKRHKDLFQTACPGKNFCFDEITKGETMKKELTSANDIIWELKNGDLKVSITDVSGAVAALENAKKAESPLYWILRKIVNK